MDVLKTAGELLVKSGYAASSDRNLSDTYYLARVENNQGHFEASEVDPFANTIVGRRQADVIETYLAFNESTLWHHSKSGIESTAESCHKQFTTHHKWRLDRIKWCLEQLTKP